MSSALWGLYIRMHQALFTASCSWKDSNNVKAPSVITSTGGDVSLKCSLDVMEDLANLSESEIICAYR